MSAVTVFSDPDAADGAAEILSSLPRSYASVPTPALAQLRVVAGAPGWPHRVGSAIVDGAEAVIVIHPEPADLTALIQRPQPVVLDCIWADNVAVPEAAELFSAAAPASQLLQCRIITGPERPLPACLLDVAALLRALRMPLIALNLLHHTRSGLLATGTVADLTVVVSVDITTAQPSQASVNLVTDDGAVELSIPHPATAQPAALARVGPSGSHSQPSMWETSHRTAWRRARRLLESGEPAADLICLATDQSVLSSALALLGQ